MGKNMLIDAAHAEETRVVVLSGHNLEEFDVETKARQQIRGNIYLAKVTRVEPSLQAGFIDFGSIRHGFLAFSEVHPDYYQIPIEDREALIAEEAAMASDDSADEDDEGQRARRAQNRRYKIQDVLRRRQIMLVQAVKEERGNKGAALTTYLSLAGRYCVLMPNTPRGGGISRKISAVSDRKRLKSIVSELEVPKGMGLIIRTAGAKHNKTEIKRDYEYLLRLWDDIRARTLESVSPCLIHEEESLVKRAVRDLYNKDVGSIIVEGEAAYREAKDFVKMLIPSHARKVHQYKHSLPLFSRMGVDELLSGIHDGVVQLKSGGYLVINQTEALVAVDVNSGKSTRERSIEQTALKTNLEAADEVARQMRLRDLAGLIVIDFIDMDESRNDRAVEKRMKDALRLDRARVQMGKISSFGLMEISRQRRRTGVLEGSSHVCETCSGFGRVRSPSSTATQIIREIEAALAGRKGSEVDLRTDTSTALYLLNEKRLHLAQLQTNRGIIIKVIAVSQMPRASYEFEITNLGIEIDEPEFNFAYLKEDEVNTIDEIDEIEESAEIFDTENGEGEEITISKSKRRRPRRRGRASENNNLNTNNGESDNELGEGAEEVSTESDNNTAEEHGLQAEGRDNQTRNKRRRGRRGGRNRRDNQNNGETNAASDGNASVASDISPVEAAEDVATVAVLENEIAAKPARKSRARAPKVADVETAIVEPSVSDAQIVTEVSAKPARKPRKSAKATASDEVSIVASAQNDSAKEESLKSASTVVPEVASAPKRTGWWARNAEKLFGNGSDEAT